jgi:chromosome segregation ATPase
MNQTPEELAEQLAKRLAIEHLPHPFELSALPLILSAIQSATQPLVRRVEELENSELQLVDQRDSAESALGDAYESVIGRAPEWSSAFGYTNAVDEIGESLAALTARVKELETALQHSAGITERLTAENAELRKALTKVRKYLIAWGADAHQCRNQATEIANIDAALQVIDQSNTP